jgi:GGDEF domain-containing protein
MTNPEPRGGGHWAATMWVFSLVLAATVFRYHRKLVNSEIPAHTDELTKLGNRRALIGALDRALSAGQPVALLLLDLEGFKAINDTHGHAAGDLILRVVAHRTANTLGRRGQVSRLGGDEFAVVINHDDPSAVQKCVDEVRTALTRPICTGFDVVTVGRLDRSRYPHPHRRPPD